MHQGAVVVVLLGLVGVHQGVPLDCKPLNTNQNFDLDRFMGKWYDVAVASDCPLIKQVTGEVAISSLELRRPDRPGKVSTTRTIWRQGTCKQTSGEYELSNTPGRFTYHVPKWGADVEVHLLHTDYDKYAIVLHTSTERATGKRVTTMKLYKACMLQPDGGPCFGILLRYFYNSTSMSCQSFSYGGCAGNQNNFLSERECLQSCRTEASCRLPMAASPCSAQPPVWAFDSSRGLCLPYKQGYCQGNSNKFYSKAECEEYCGVVKDGEGEFLRAD
ncbi:protein AMBP-like [Osmerus mordax]|uniref:protein AMBP-like n=1 Tax=Osmerus mordax TaxID=8014 RepID=UPI00350F465D